MEQEELKNQNNDKKIAIKIENLNKSYGKKHVLNDLNLEVYEGELFGYVGKNGVGKSTTIDCLIGAKKFDSGHIFINGFDILKQPFKAKKQFGYVSSEPTTYEMMTGYEYLQFIGSVYNMSDDAYQNNLKYLSNKLDLPDTDLKRIIATYSHGMKQKLCLIASLIANPKVWIMDEPTVGLDIMVFETLKEMMVEFKKHQKTIFITSHNIDLVAKICDRVALVNNGRIEKVIDLNKDPDKRYQLNKIFLDMYKRSEEKEKNDDYIA